MYTQLHPMTWQAFRPRPYPQRHVDHHREHGRFAHRGAESHPPFTFQQSTCCMMTRVVQGNQCEGGSMREPVYAEAAIGQARHPVLHLTTSWRFV